MKSLFWHKMDRCGKRYLQLYNNDSDVQKWMFIYSQPNWNQNELKSIQFQTPAGSAVFCRHAECHANNAQALLKKWSPHHPVTDQPAGAATSWSPWPTETANGYVHQNHRSSQAWLVFYREIWSTKQWRGVFGWKTGLDSWGADFGERPFSFTQKVLGSCMWWLRPAPKKPEMVVEWVVLEQSVTRLQIGTAE